MGKIGADGVRQCDCESRSCHPKADCKNPATIKTLYSTVCVKCAAKLPLRFLDFKSRAAGERDE